MKQSPKTHQHIFHISFLFLYPHYVFPPLNTSLRSYMYMMRKLKEISVTKITVDIKEVVLCGVCFWERVFFSLSLAIINEIYLIFVFLHFIANKECTKIDLSSNTALSTPLNMMMFCSLQINHIIQWELAARIVLLWCFLCTLNQQENTSVTSGSISQCNPKVKNTKDHSSCPTGQWSKRISF